MNKIKKFIPVFLISIILGGCIEKSNKNQESTLTVVTGNVSNLQVYPNTKEFTLDILDFRGKKTIFRDSIKSDGSFKFEFDLYATQDINIYPKVGKIIAQPGDSIHLNIDFKDIGNVHFSGDGRKSNTDLYKYLNSNYSVFEFRNRETRKMNPPSYKYFCDSVKTVAEQKRQEFIKETNPSQLIVKWTKDYINTAYQKSLLTFPHYLAYKSKIKYEDLDIPNDYYNFLENIEESLSDSIFNTKVYELINAYTGSFAQRTIKDTTLSKDEYISTLISSLSENHTESFLKQILIGNIFYQSLNRNDLDFFTDNKMLLEKNVHEPSLKIPLNNYYNDLQKQMENIEIHSNAILAKLKGTSVKSVIDEILSKNKGKVIYIDFWATWCGPCKAEMPNSKKLKKKLEGEDIVFVYICLNSEERQWKLNLSQMQLDGTHYFCNKEQSKSIRESFEIKGIPHYMLINKNGHIFEAGSYLRPMRPLTIKKIEKLLSDV